MIYVTEQDKKMLKSIGFAEAFITPKIHEHFKVEIQGDDIEFQITNCEEVWNWTRPTLHDEHIENPILVPMSVLKEVGDTKVELNGKDSDDRELIGLDITNKIGTLDVKAANVRCWPNMFADIDNPVIVWRQELSFDVLNKLVPAIHKNNDGDGARRVFEGLLVTHVGLAATDCCKLYWHSDDYKVSDFMGNFSFHLPVTWRKKVVQKSKTLDAVRIEVKRKCQVTEENKEGIHREYYEITTMKVKDCVLDCMVKALDYRIPNIEQIIPQEHEHTLVFSDADIESMEAALKNKYEAFVLTLDGTMTYKTNRCEDGPKRRWEGSEITEPIAVNLEMMLEALKMGCKEFLYKDYMSPIKAQGTDGINAVIMPKLDPDIVAWHKQRKEAKKIEEGQVA